MVSYDILSINGIISALATSKNSTHQKIATLRATSKTSAVRIAKIQIENKLIKNPNTYSRKTTKVQNKGLKSIGTTNETPKKGIFCDFNGVLDNGKRSDEININYRLAKETCPHKAFKLLSLAIKHDAIIVMSSQHRILEAEYYPILKKALRQSGFKEYVDFINNNRQQIRNLCSVNPTGRGSSRRNEIIEYADFARLTHFVVFEDEHHIGDDLNAIMTETRIGLTDSHIERGDTFLNEAL